MPMVHVDIARANLDRGKKAFRYAEKCPAGSLTIRAGNPW
jgi:hypothetical protein